MRVLVTGSAGFIGFHVAHQLVVAGHDVVGVDGLTPYYDVKLKQRRHAILLQSPNFSARELMLEDASALARVYGEHRPEVVIHLAAQAGVRYSLQHPHAYLDSNLSGFLNILEGCRHRGTRHLVFASSSSVYGSNKRMPFSIHDNVDHPISLYAATKKANELMAHSYSHLYGLPATGLRFLTVYGPWGRPDMAMFIFAKAITEGGTIRLFNYGRMRRDFTYVDDIVEGIERVMHRVPVPDPSWSADRGDAGGSSAPYRLYNIGNSQPVELMDLIETLEKELGKKAEMNLLPMQPGDVPATFADVEALTRDVGFKPATPIETGVKNFVDWYRAYYKV